MCFTVSDTNLWLCVSVQLIGIFGHSVCFNISENLRSNTSCYCNNSAKSSHNRTFIYIFQQAIQHTVSHIYCVSSLNRLIILHQLMVHISFFRYLWAGLLVVVGIYLNIFSKRNKMTTRELMMKLGDYLRLPNKFRHLFELHQKEAMFEV